jgi:hypothetical protein
MAERAAPLGAARDSMGRHWSASCRACGPPSGALAWVRRQILNDETLHHDALDQREPVGTSRMSTCSSLRSELDGGTFNRTVSL